ncbi:MAG: rRNA maturation RNase YbeY [Oscillospiraceae bacterium]|jgi:probable rRNA maturation factor|nr:rRNA maturation RNase YbeY [Oscillospiraceae bacterium]
MDKLKVSISNIQKDIKIPTGIRLLVRKCCHAVLRAENMHGMYEVSVSFLDNAQIRELNHDYRNRDAATDVLSFPSGENRKFDINAETGAEMLGDIAISIPKVYEQAEHYGHSLQREFAYLTVHSMLHLLGYDHEQGGIAAVRMREKEEAVLAMLGLQRDSSYVINNEEG